MGAMAGISCVRLSGHMHVFDGVKPSLFQGHGLCILCARWHSFFECDLLLRVGLKDGAMPCHTGSLIPLGAIHGWSKSLDAF